MNKKVFRKAASLVLALALVISMAPAMGIVSASEIRETTQFVMAPRLFTITELTGSGESLMPSGYTVDFLYDYLDAGMSKDGTQYHRDWKLFRTNCATTGSVEVKSDAGVLFSGFTSGSWVALKIRGFEAGMYNIKIRSLPLKGRTIGLYVLDDTYSDMDVSGITDVINNYESKAGVQKVGTADAFGKVGVKEKLYDSNYNSSYYCIDTALSELEFGNVTFDKGNSEYIFVFRYDAYGKADGNETIPSGDKNIFSIAAISFAPTTVAKNATVFGDTAAFIEQTDDGKSFLYLLSAIDSLDYNNVGFDNITINNEDVGVLDTKTVYEKIIIPNENDSSFPETEFKSKEFGIDNGYVYVVKKELGAFAGQTVKFRPFAVKDDETITGSTYQVKLKSN